MAIQISPKSQELIEELVASGRYADIDTAVEAAIAILAEQERKLAWLKTELARAQEQVDRGDLIDFTPEYAERKIQEAIERYHTRALSQHADKS